MQKIVTAKCDLFYRAGRGWTQDQVKVEESEFTEAQWQSLSDDPMLVVVDAPLKVDAAPLKGESKITQKPS